MVSDVPFNLYEHIICTITETCCATYIATLGRGGVIMAIQFQQKLKRERFSVLLLFRLESVGKDFLIFRRDVVHF